MVVTTTETQPNGQFSSFFMHFIDFVALFFLFIFPLPPGSVLLVGALSTLRDTTAMRCAGSSPV